MSDANAVGRQRRTVNWGVSLLVGLGLIVLFGFLISLAGSPFAVVPLREDDEFTALLQRLGVFVILALFVERAVQVYVTAFLEEEQLAVKAKVAAAKLQGEDANSNPILAKAIEDKQNNHFDTKIRTTTASLVLGTLIGLCGVSALSALLEPQAAMPLPLRIVDIVIVGTLLCGGAEPIHQIMQAITNSLKQVKERTKTSSTP